MSATFLSRDEVAELTGYQIPSKQLAKLREYGLRHFVAADGRPRVVRSEIEGRKEAPRTRPNLAALRRTG